MALFALREIGWKMLRIDLDINFGSSDHTLAFINSHVFLKQHPTTVDCCFKDTVASNVTDDVSAQSE